MPKLLTLRNILTFFILLFFVACNEVNDDDSIRKIASSEDNYESIIDAASDPATGQPVFVIVQK